MTGGNESRVEDRHCDPSADGRSNLLTMIKKIFTISVLLSLIFSGGVVLAQGFSESFAPEETGGDTNYAYSQWKNITVSLRRAGMGDVRIVLTMPDGNLPVVLASAFVVERSGNGEVILYARNPKAGDHFIKVLATGSNPNLNILVKVGANYLGKSIAKTLDLSTKLTKTSEAGGLARPATQTIGGGVAGKQAPLAPAGGGQRRPIEGDSATQAALEALEDATGGGQSNEVVETHGAEGSKLIDEANAAKEAQKKADHEQAKRMRRRGGVIWNPFW